MPAHSSFFLRASGIATVCTDVEMNVREDGQETVSFTLVISRDNGHFKGKETVQERFRCYAFDIFGRKIHKHICKGSKVYVEAELRQLTNRRTYQPYVVLYVDKCIWLGGKRKQKVYVKESPVDTSDDPNDFLLGLDDIAEETAERPQNNDDGTFESLPEDNLTKFTEIEFEDPESTDDDIGLLMPIEEQEQKE